MIGFTEISIYWRILALNVFTLFMCRGWQGRSFQAAAPLAVNERKCVFPWYTSNLDMERVEHVSLEREDCRVKYPARCELRRGMAMDDLSHHNVLGWKR